VVGQDIGALAKHLALIGFMGVGKTTVGREVARLVERPFVDTDEEIEKRHGPIARIFEEQGEAEFRRLEEQVVAEALATPEPAVIALGGGALLADATRSRLRRAHVIWLDVDADTAWERARGGERPLAREESEFRRLFDERSEAYSSLRDDVADNATDVVLGALRTSIEHGNRRVCSDAPAVVIGDEQVLSLHAPPHAERLYSIPAGERAKTLEVAERLWNELVVDREGVLIAFGGGTTTDLAGFVAATFLRGIRWVAVPTTLVGQVDAAIGGKTGIDLGKGKNLVGAFHFPEQVIIDPELLSTLPDEERRAGMAEVVKAGLLAGRPLWELPEEEMIRGAAAFKCAVVLSDPYEQGRRAILNLGHTFAHALETASDYTLRHGDAVALGLLAALRLSGRPTDVVEEVLRPEPVHVDPERAWAAMSRDKKAREGKIRMVLLEEPGRPVFPAELPGAEVRRALEALIEK